MVLARVLHVRQDVTPTYPSTRITKQCESETKPSMHRLDTFSMSAQVDYRYVLDLEFCVDLENDIRFHLRPRFWPLSKCMHFIGHQTLPGFWSDVKKVIIFEFSIKNEAGKSICHRHFFSHKKVLFMQRNSTTFTVTTLHFCLTAKRLSYLESAWKISHTGRVSWS